MAKVYDTPETKLVALLIVLLGVLVACGIAESASPSSASPSDTGWWVVRVIDGDTFRVSDGRSEVTVRVIGADTPEVVAPGRPVECYGPEASRYAHRALHGQRVTLTPDPAAGDTDRYGRLLRHVRLPDGSLYADGAVRGGYARVYVYRKQQVQGLPRLWEAQREAQQWRRGLWGACAG